MRASIVIGTLNRPQVVLKLLLQLINQSKSVDFEVLVYDQSTAENYKKLQNQFPKQENFKLIHLDKPNTCRYLNLGWKNGSSEIVLYLDDDVTITEKTITEHIKKYDDKSILGVAGRVINDKEKTLRSTQVGKIISFGAIIKKNFFSKYSGFVDFPYGCNMSFRKSILKEFNGFDERLQPPIHSFNEVDLGCRITKRFPKSIFFNKEALVYHHRYKFGGTRSYSEKEVNDSNQFNYGYSLGKNFTLLENILCFIRRLPYQLIKEPGAITQIFKGYFYAKKFKFKILNF